MIMTEAECRDISRVSGSYTTAVMGWEQFTAAQQGMATVKSDTMRSTQVFILIDCLPLLVDFKSLTTSTHPPP